MSLVSASYGEYLGEVISSVLPEMKHASLEKGRWPHLSACHAVLLLESSVSLFMYLSIYDRMRRPFPLSTTHTTASPASSGLPLAPLVRSLGCFFPFPGHRTPRCELLFRTDDLSSQHRESVQHPSLCFRDDAIMDVSCFNEPLISAGSILDLA
jgi:hypothetical protein